MSHLNLRELETSRDLMNLLLEDLTWLKIPELWFMVLSSISSSEVVRAAKDNLLIHGLNSPCNHSLLK